MTTDRRMPTTRLIILTVAAMIAFAANSLLCREALASGSAERAAARR